MGRDTTDDRTTNMHDTVAKTEHGRREIQRGVVDCRGDKLSNLIPCVGIANHDRDAAADHRRRSRLVEFKRDVRLTRSL